MELRLLSRMAAVALALAGACGAGRADDPLESADCRRALDALDVQEAVVQPADEPGHGAALARLASLRQDAARACLGGGAAALVPQRLAQPRSRCRA